MAGFAARQMREDEYEVLRVRFSRGVFTARLILAVLVYAVFCSFGIYGQLFSLIAAILLVLRPMVDFYLKELCVTNRRVLGRSGFFSARIIKLEMESIDAAAVSKSVTDRLFHTFTLTITVKNEKPVVYSGLPDGEAVKKKIEEMKERLAAKEKSMGQTGEKSGKMTETDEVQREESE